MTDLENDKNNKDGGIFNHAQTRKFKALKFKSKAKAGSAGAFDAPMIKEILIDDENWEKLGDELDAMGDDRELLVEHFNSGFENDVGDALFGEGRDCAAFGDVFELYDDKEQTNLMDELFKQGVLDKDAIVE